MSRRITLRKCPEHENCQLQAVDGGAFEHTSNRLTLDERLAGRFDHAAEKRDLQKSLEKADYLQSILTADREVADSLKSELRAGIAGLAKTLDAQDKANRAREFLDFNLKTAQEGLERLERASQKFAREADRQSAKLSELEMLETRLRSKEAQADEILRATSEKLTQVEALATTLEERRSQFDRLDALYDTVDQLSVDLRIAVAHFQSIDRETRRQIEHERKERLEATAKGLRSLREHIKVSHV